MPESRDTITLKCLFLLSVVLILFSFRFLEVKAYNPDTTHAALTQEIVEFYNLLYPDKAFTDEEKEWIIQGSIDEDQGVRAINHLYDPINRISWTGEKGGKFSA